MREGNRCEQRFEEKQSNGKNKWTGLKGWVVGTKYGDVK